MHSSAAPKVVKPGRRCAWGARKIFRGMLGKMAFAFEKVCIIGGAGDFGSWYAEFFKKKGSCVVICSRSESAGRLKAQVLGVSFERDFAKAASGADLVVASVPIDAVGEVLETVSAAAKKGALVVDFASVKKQAVRALSKISKKRKGVEFASIHPMHGPRAISIEGVSVVFIPVKAGEKYSALKRVFEDEGCKVVESTAEEHDRVLSVVQGLAHFACISSAAAMKSSGVDLKRAREFSSPLFEVFLSAVGRVVLQNPDTYAKIQVENPANKKMRALFASEARRVAAIANAGDSAVLAREISECGRAFKSVDEVLAESDKATMAVHAEARALKELVGRKVCLQNVATSAVHYGVLKKFAGKTVSLVENSKETALNVSNVRLLPKAEFSKWRGENLREKTRDYSIVVPRGADEKIVAQLLSGVGGVARASVVGTFEGAQVGEGKKSVTVRCAFFEDDGLQAIDAGVKAIITGLGFSLR